MAGEMEQLDGSGRGNLLPVRIPGTNDLFWVPPQYIDQAESAVSQMMMMRRSGSAGAGTVGTFADIGEAVADFFGSEQIQRQVDKAHSARRDVLEHRKAFRDTLSAGAQQTAFMNWQDAQDEQDQAQTAALETAITMLKVGALAAAGRGLGRIFSGGNMGMPGMGGGFNWGAAVAGGIAGFGLSALFDNQTDRPSRRAKRDPWV